MGNRYGDSTQNILAWYALIKMLISWLSLGLFAGGYLVRQILGIPMWESVIALVSFAGLFAFAGGLKAIAKVNFFQMILLIAVSLTLTIMGVTKAGGLSAVCNSAGLSGCSDSIFLYRSGNGTICIRRQKSGTGAIGCKLYRLA
jgi:Na+/proline symporter